MEQRHLNIEDFVDNIYFQKDAAHFQQLIELLSTTKQRYFYALKNADPELVKWIDDAVPLLSDSQYKITTKCNWIVSGRTEFPVCTNPTCRNFGKDDAFKKLNLKVFEPYPRFCDRKCQNSHPEKLSASEKTCFERYGTKTTLAVKEFRDKGVETMLKTYGVSSPGQLEKNHQIQLKKSYENYLLNNDYDEPMFSLEDYYARANDDELLKFKCKRCGLVFYAKHKDGHHHRCPKCYDYKYTSQQEKSLAEFVKSIVGNDTVQENCKDVIYPGEVDIYVPSKKLAIEYDGLYWHSDDQKPDHKFHLKKTELCEAKGIQLIHVFENEWITKPEIVKSRIRNLLGAYDKIVYARKCVIKEVDSKMSKAFQEQNHIQGSVHSSVNIGLFFEDELISLMTFGKTRFSKKYEWELLRFCSKLNWHVIGAASKLLKHFEKEYSPKSLVSYADRRWSQGKVYKAIGFNLEHASLPNYWYWKDASQIYSRVKFQKHTLERQLETYDPNLTEVQNMKNNHYSRIFDCGNLVFAKKSKQ